MYNAETKQTVDISSHGNAYQGLSLDEVKELRKKYGENRIPEEKKYQYGRSCLIRLEVHLSTLFLLQL